MCHAGSIVRNAVRSLVAAPLIAMSAMVCAQSNGLAAAPAASAPVSTTCEPSGPQSQVLDDVVVDWQCDVDAPAPSATEEPSADGAEAATDMPLMLAAGLVAGLVVGVGTLAEDADAD